MENENNILENNTNVKETIVSENMNKEKDVNSKILKKIKRMELMNYLILILLTVVLVFNVVGINNGGNNVADVAEKSLPKNLNKDVANKLIDEIAEYYNNDESEKLYNILGDYAKTAISYNDFTKSIEQLKTIGKIESASYTHYEYMGYQEGADWYVLNYIARFNTGNGDVTVTILTKNNNWEVVGFRLNVHNFK